MTPLPLFVLAAFALAAFPPGLAAWQLSTQTPSSAPPPAAAKPPESRAERVAWLEGERREVRTELSALRSQASPQGGAGAAGLEVRIAELERRLQELEAELAKLRADSLRGVPGPQTPADPTGLQPADLLGQRGQVTAGNAFNPAITVIPDGVYYNDNREGGVADILASAAGFDSHPSGESGHAHGEVERGFNLRELEVSFSGSVDPYFDAWAILAIGGGEIEAEEAYVQTRQFIPGLQLRFGKFYSGIGYLNRQHPHQWDFVDQALPYELLFGGPVNEVGVQATWLPSLPIYALVGFEALQGENAGVSQHIGPEAAAYFTDRAGPRLFTGFVKVAPDIGYSGALQFGASIGHSRLHQEQHDEDTEPEALEGTTTFFGLDAVYRYDSGKARGAGDVTLQGEYFRRGKSLDVVGLGPDPVTGPLRDFAQDGLYAQVVYGFAPRWTTAFRFDTAGLVNREDEGGAVTSFESSRRYSVNVTFNPTEFSRFRVQYTRGDFAGEGGRETYNQVWVQFQMSLGAHGAHRF